MDTGSRPDANPTSAPQAAGPSGVAPTGERRPDLPPGAQPARRAQPGEAYPGQASPQGPAQGGRPPRRRRRLTWLWVLLAILAVGAVVWFLTHSGKPATSAGGGRHGGAGGSSMPTTVGVGQAVRGDVPIYLNQLGAVTPLATVTVRSQISGYLQQIAFREGQMVTKGQFLAQVDPRPYQAALMQAEGALARDQASLAEAQLDLKRYQLLLSQDSIARQQVDVQAATVKQDEGTVKTDEAAIVTQKLNLTYAHVTSPVTGRVGLRQVDLGNYVTSGDTNGLVVVTQLTPIDVLFTLPEDNLPQVQARTHAGATLPVTALDRTGQTVLAEGQLLTLDNQIDPTTGTVKAKARFENGAGDLFPQQFVNVRILVDTLKNATVAPTAAVLRGPNGLFVYVVQGGVNAHTVTVRSVKTGPAAGDKTAILSGLQPGETVVTDGTDRLREGARVILPGDCIPAMGAGGRGGRRGHHGGQGGGPAQAGAPPPGGGCPKGEQRAGQPAPASNAANQQAETPDLGGQNRGPGGRVQALLAQLDLDPQQQLKAQAIFTAARGQVMTAAANAGDNPDARRQAAHQIYDQAFAQLDAVLRPDQRAKAAQLRAEAAKARAEHAGGDPGGGGQP